jgi:RNA polymerase sigma factor (TIGR02999 family)
LNSVIGLSAVSDVTDILFAIDQGDPAAAEKLLPLVYLELRSLAAQKMARENQGQTLDATALVHEAYLRLVGGQPERLYRDRRHFLAAAATAMRRILVDNARRKRSVKHGGGRSQIPIDPIAGPDNDDQLIALNVALDKLTELDAIKAKLVELRFFAGLTGEQAADVLGISPSTADRYWTYARAWLQTEIERE